MASIENDLSTGTTVRWRRSSYSNGSGGNCVEVAVGVPGLVPVRDSKRAGDGPELRFRTAAWTAFMAGVQMPEPTRGRD
ncbi:DUF397 domain-containing protein [Streptomyces poriticola]|uniref:DUF397 domain-containing protein n=1 Tax=Streptomyces poriticola TaxID=3120506 RepID=UPI002FCE203C